MAIEYNQDIQNTSVFEGTEIPGFIASDKNIDEKTVASFGEEWAKFNKFDEADIKNIGDMYFDIIPDEATTKDWNVLDVGCGSGRWSMYIANKVKHVHSVDPSDAVYMSVKNTASVENIKVSRASVDNLPFADESFDMVFSLGVLHHIPDTQQGITQCVKKVKKGGKFLVYLYYSLDNRGGLFKALFHASNLLRRGICRMPSWLKRATCDLLAVLFYMPFVLFSRFLRFLFPKKNIYKKVPLSFYADQPFYIIRNDSLDRFGTPLEQRFSRKEIHQMMENAGLTNIKFSEKEPYWHAVGEKK